ncbi:MAG: DUF2961 domain-containing protein [Planctomycetota bacterium]|jgi:hypothetical protein
MRTPPLAIVILAAALSLPRAAVAADYHGYEALSDWQSVPLDKTGVTAGLASSYDRSGSNSDYNHYQSPSGFQTEDVQQVTVTTIDGPGVISRFWMPHACANSAFDVKIFIDGELRIDTTSDVMLGGSYGYITPPLVTTLIGGQVSYEPIAFSQSLRIESNNFDTSSGYAKRHYYQYGYRRLPAGTSVTAYSGALTTEQQQARNAVVSMITNVGANPAGASASAVVLSQGAATIPAAGSITLADLSGGGTVRRLNVKMAGATDAELDGLRVRVRYDGSSQNAIDVPVSHFFGAGHGRVAYKSLPLGTSGPDGFYCYWPMPYRQGVVMELYNESASAISIDSAAVEYEATAVSPDAGYLHAVQNEVSSTNAAKYQLLRVSGRGHYVGNLLWVDRQVDGYYGRCVLEGDDIITVNVDGGEPMVLWGTGLEDAYNGGYYYNHVLEQPGEPADPYSGIGPYHGLLRMNFPEVGGTGDNYAHTDQYRWLIGDFVSFTEGIEVEQEQYYTSYGASFGSTAFYYALPILGDANRDGAVDTQDFTILKANLGDAGVWDDADFNGDGLVDTQDFTILKAHLGEGAGGAVPEPVTMWLLGLAGLAVLRRRRG